MKYGFRQDVNRIAAMAALATQFRLCETAQRGSEEIE
jgi:hypothetical protein